MRKAVTKTDIVIIIVLLALFLLIAFKEAGSSITKTSAPEEARALTLDDYEGKKLGTIPGSGLEQDLVKRYPNNEFEYYTGIQEMALALESGFIDGFAAREITLIQMERQGRGLTVVPEVLGRKSRFFGFAKTAKGEKLCKQMNELLAELNADGTIKELEDIWYGDDESLKVVDTSHITGENGEILVGVNLKDEPYDYVRDNEETGLNIDLLTRFAKKYGYSIKYEEAEVTSVLLGLTNGNYDMIATAISYSDERAEIIYFSDPVFYCDNYLAVRKSDLAALAPPSETEKPGFIESLGESFEKNFIRENRWLLILQGIATTCEITFFATIFGSLLAFGICMFRKTGSNLANLISDIFVKTLQGTPIVVVLLILYYVVFSNSSFGAVRVAIVGFSLNFAAYTSETLRSGINSVPPGQKEAALALGYSENQTFFEFIFPQAVKRVFPIYRGEIITLLKSTAVAGYISVKDLTKMSDIIRSRTYESFFPLITTAIIYFLLARIITVFLGLILSRLDPRGAGKEVRES